MLRLSWCVNVSVIVILIIVEIVIAAPATSPVNPKKGVRVKNVEEGDLFEGDIILSDDQERAINIAAAARVALSGIVGEKYRWEERVVHYEISSEYDGEERELIEGAMEELAEKTCVQFLERDGEEDFIKIEDGDGCSSKVGKRGGEQTVTLSRNGCMKHGVAIHEIVHALGFWHEQSRTDRDQYVNIIWKNILPGKYNNFKKYLRAEIYDYQVPYDYNSVMHYKADAFKRDDTDEDTIVPKDPKAEIGQREGLSELDARKINFMYCPELIKNGTYTPAGEGSTEEGDGSEGAEGSEGSEGGDEDTVNDITTDLGITNSDVESDDVESESESDSNSKSNEKSQTRTSINFIPALKRKMAPNNNIIKNIQMSNSQHIVSSFISPESRPGSREMMQHS